MDYPNSFLSCCTTINSYYCTCNFRAFLSNKKLTALETSCGKGSPKDVLLLMLANFVLSSPEVISVSIYPGAIQLTVMLALPNSLDNDLVKPSKPALVAP